MIATVVLLTTVAAGSGVVLTCLAGRAQTEAVGAAEGVLQQDVERLASLPFSAASPPAVAAPPEGTGEVARDVVGELFPHSRSDRNEESRYYVDAGGSEDEPAGSFVTRVRRGDVRLTRVARFVVAPDWRVLASNALDGWAVWYGDAPPAGALAVHFTAIADGHRREAKVVFLAVRPGAVDECRDGGGGG